MIYTKESKWQTHLGNTVTIEGMSDEHLANTIQFVEFYDRRFNFNSLITLCQEAYRRGLSWEYCQRAQFPYKDGQGNYIVWDFQNHCPKVVGSYLRG